VGEEAPGDLFEVAPGVRRAERVQPGGEQLLVRLGTRGADGGHDAMGGKIGHGCTYVSASNSIPIIGIIRHSEKPFQTRSWLVLRRALGWTSLSRLDRTKCERSPRGGAHDFV